jgi:hypothetical protein
MMLAGKQDSIDEYVHQREANPREVENLHHDLLIQVTRFFREPESYAAMRKTVFPARRRGPHRPRRGHDHRVRLPGPRDGARVTLRWDSRSLDTSASSRAIVARLPLTVGLAMRARD